VGLEQLSHEFPILSSRVERVTKAISIGVEIEDSLQEFFAQPSCVILPQPFAISSAWTRKALKNSRMCGHGGAAISTGDGLIIYAELALPLAILQATHRLSAGFTYREYPTRFLIRGMAEALD
jgi:hypothetical protein